MFIATPETVQGAGSFAYFGFCAKLQSLIVSFLSFVSLITTSWLQSSFLQEEQTSEKQPELTATAKTQKEEQAATKILEICTASVATVESPEGLQQEPKLVDIAERHDAGQKQFKYPEAGEQQEPEFVDTAERHDVGPKYLSCPEAEEQHKFVDTAARQDEGLKNIQRPEAEEQREPKIVDTTARPKQIENPEAHPAQIAGSAEIETVATRACRPSFADMLRNQKAREPGSERSPGGGCLPPSHGYRFAAAGMQRRRRVVDTSCPSDCKQSSLEGGDELDSAVGSASHGWSKQHKASRNAKLQRKVDWSKQRRAEQSRASRFYEEDE